MARSTRTLEEFIEELEQFVIQNGLEDWTIAELADQLRCSKRRIYDVAENKSELFLFVARRVFGSTLEKCRQAAQAENDVVAAIYAYLTCGAKNAARLNVKYLRELEASVAGKKLFDEYQEARSRGMLELLEEGLRIGRFSGFHSHLVNEAILGAAQRIRNAEFLVKNGLTLEQAFGELYRVLLNGILH